MTKEFSGNKKDIMDSRWIKPLLLLLAAFSVFANEDGNYRVGVGIADVTGPAAELAMVKLKSFAELL